MTLAVTGSRHWKDAGRLRRELDKAIRELEPDRIIIGDARGADDIACRFVDSQWWFLELERYEVTDEEWKKNRGAGVIRNSRLIADADKVIAFRAEGVSRGTDDAIAKARATRKLYRIVRENGEIEDDINRRETERD